MTSDANAPVLVATDLRPKSRLVVDFAAQIAQRLERPLCLVHASDVPRERSAVGASEAIAPYLETLRERLEARVVMDAVALDEECDRVSSVAKQVSRLVVDGRAWEAIVEEADRQHAAYVVVGAHATSNDELVSGVTRHRLLGSTADRVVRHANTSVWVVPNGLRVKRLDRWVVGTDFSRSADAAVAHAYELASRFGGTLTLLHAIPTSDVDAASSVKADAERALYARAAALTAGSEPIESEVLVTDAPLHEALLSRMAALDADVFVVGPCGHTSLGDRILGSTSERCLWESPIPMLISRGS